MVPQFFDYSVIAQEGMRTLIMVGVLPATLGGCRASGQI